MARDTVIHSRLITQFSPIRMNHVQYYPNRVVVHSLKAGTKLRTTGLALQIFFTDKVYRIRILEKQLSLFKCTE